RGTHELPSMVGDFRVGFSRGGVALRVGNRVFWAVAALIPSVATAGDVSFNRDIRPILAENCFACHGFCAKQGQGDLRPGGADSAFAERSGGFAIKPGDLEKSDVWQRINSTDPTEVMPPPAAKKTLTAAQKETIRKWIEQGAAYQKHWSFETPVQPE